MLHTMNPKIPPLMGNASSPRSISDPSNTAIHTLKGQAEAEIAPQDRFHGLPRPFRSAPKAKTYNEQRRAGPGIEHHPHKNQQG